MFKPGLVIFSESIASNPSCASGDIATTNSSANSPGFTKFTLKALILVLNNGVAGEFPVFTASVATNTGLDALALTKNAPPDSITFDPKFAPKPVAPFHVEK